VLGLPLPRIWNRTITSLPPLVTGIGPSICRLAKSMARALASTRICFWSLIASSMQWRVQECEKMM
jgi:hypothetical protein